MRLLVLSFFLAFTSISWAQRIVVQRMGVEVDEADLKLVMSNFRFQKNFLNKVYDSLPDSDIQVKVFGHYADYSAYALSCCEMTPLSTGFFNQNNGEVVLFHNEEFVKTLTHELNHALTRNKLLRKVNWLDEGLADVMAAKQVKVNGEAQEQLIYFSDKISGICTARGRLKRFIIHSNRDWDSMTTYDSYAVAWALVNFMYAEQSNFLIQLLGKIETGMRPMEAIEKHYRGGFKGFHKDLGKFYGCRQ